MMETKEKNKQWHLIRNDNGEWISDEYAVLLTPLEATILKALAVKQRKKLSIQHGEDGLLWCYKHEYESIDMSTPPPVEHKLKIKKSYQYSDKVKEYLQKLEQEILNEKQDMKDRTDDFDIIRELLNQKTGVSDLPQDYNYKFEKQKKTLVIKLSEKGLKANMQDNGSAFESWAIILKFYLSDVITTVTIDWEDLHYDDGVNLHFNRFVYRLTKFIQTYEWASAARPIPPTPSVLVCNFPIGGAAKYDKHSEGSEGWIECKYVEKYRYDYEVMDHQLPVGIFYNKVSRDTHYTTGQKSAIDIWAIRNQELFIFELKKPNNKVLGVISELMFYTNILQDILSHRIQYRLDTKMQVAIENNFRGFGDLYRLYKSGNIQNINAIILSQNVHPLIQLPLLDFINDSARLKYCRIRYSMQKVEL